jgi:general L-amino acid transport system permease protein
VFIFPLFILIIRGLLPEGTVFPVVRSNLWGGLLLTFLLTVVGIVFSFPLGVALALGRRSELPVIRTICVVYIEFVRGVPLITILFMAQFMVPLFLPGGSTVDRVLRAMIGITLFSAAYLAENVRGGLQSIPNGQYEAAYALGLSGFQTMVRIILPQALRAVIPILVGQFISLFKDTSLVAIVGLFDLLGIADAVLAQPRYIGRQAEVYLFISVIYFIFSYNMSYVSQRLEKSLGVGER